MLCVFVCMCLYAECKCKYLSRRRKRSRDILLLRVLRSTTDCGICVFQRISWLELPGSFYTILPFASVVSVHLYEQRPSCRKHMHRACPPYEPEYVAADRVFARKPEDRCSKDMDADHTLDYYYFGPTFGCFGGGMDWCRRWWETTLERAVDKADCT